MRWLRCATAVAATLTLSTAALANGRYPRGQYLKEASGDPNSLVLSATYGLLVTRDRGKHWYLVCELGLFGAKPGPLDIIETVLEQTASGTLLSGSDRALRVSRDRACTFTTDTSLPVRWEFYDPTKTNDKGLVVDLTLEKAKSDKAVLALVADLNGVGSGNQICETLDDAATWRPVGKPIPASLLSSSITLDVAPSDAKRLYVSGRRPAEGAPGPMVVVSSTDGGETWTSSDIPDSADSNGSYIAAVSATDPNVVYVRTNIWLSDQGAELGEDRLHYSSDGGKTWTEILRKRAKLMGFALSPDGKTVLAGYGDPAEPDGRQVEDADVGIYKAAAGTSNFTKIYDGSISCLMWNATGLYACAKQDRDGFHLGFAENADFDLSNKNALERLLSLPNVRGPLPWEPGKGEGVCKTDWLGNPPDVPAVCALFGACGDGGIPSDPPICTGESPEGGAGRGGAAGSGGTSSTGGAGGADGGPAGGTGGAGGAVADDFGDACACRMPGSSGRGAAGAWAAIAVAALLARRRRTR
jgi:MYXO-CTERM domain-containing protein